MKNSSLLSPIFHDDLSQNDSDIELNASKLFKLLQKMVLSQYVKDIETRTKVCKTKKCPQLSSNNEDKNLQNTLLFAILLV